ncbi:hypothetical protein H4R33_000439 [Dimargaris cristalligena]|uniref:NudC domain-containing protein 1 n=1 Tax=Dimargaris cristalligena TaxID=215637 RepID=A0A4P9ZYD0_9FUNG|nr:hypothetical protein H4R33_000439 [Dimargaris cristalligena]RKP38716.1 hypothetical protein BJ085DRAFT_40683 [Dimargaris cristalligena]|eukprot:RKP38716.1 hypothetical protein BJ085DRAFT_40683 [Dimargaris cristalligena]
MTSLFQPRSELLSSKFDGYKLQAWPTTADSRAIPLSVGLADGPIVPLSYLEATARTGQNRLVLMASAQPSSNSISTDTTSDRPAELAYLTDNGSLVNLLLDLDHHSAVTSSTTDSALHEADSAGYAGALPRFLPLDHPCTGLDYKLSIRFLPNGTIELLRRRHGTNHVGSNDAPETACSQSTGLDFEIIQRAQCPLGDKTADNVPFQLLEATIQTDNDAEGTSSPTMVRCLILHRFLRDDPALPVSPIQFTPGQIGPTRPPSMLTEHPPTMYPHHHHHQQQQPHFYPYALAVHDIPLVTSSTESTIVAPRSSVLTHQIPLQVGFSPCGTFFALAVKGPVNQPSPFPPPEPSSEGTDTATDRRSTANESAAETPSSLSLLTPPRPTYAWMQSADEVTVSYQLPVSVPADQVDCQLHRDSISLTIGTATDSTSPSPIAHELPSFKHRAFFGEIVPDESFWTIEQGHLLTLYLQKRHTKTRWTHLHQDQIAAQSTASPAMDDVPETLDPSEFHTILENLAKYTGPEAPTQLSAQQIVRQKVRHGWSRASLATGEEDQSSLIDRLLNEPPEVEDYSEGDLVITAFTVTNGQQIAQTINTNHEWLCTPFAEPASASAPILESKTAWPWVRTCLKFGVDALIYQLTWCQSAITLINPTGPVDPPWIDSPPAMNAEHVATFPAFGYVQAALQNKKFLYVDRMNNQSSNNNSGPRFSLVASRSRYIYIYYHPKTLDSPNAPQKIVDLQALLPNSPHSARDAKLGQHHSLPSLDILGIQQLDATRLAVLLWDYICLVTV